VTVESLPTPFKCVICASELDVSAQKCLKCQTWQNWKRFVPASQLTIALLLSLISVISATVPPALGYFANHSHTYVRVLGESELQEPGAYPQQSILVLVANNGKRPSIVKSASISFENLNAAPTELEIHETDQKLIPPEKQLFFHLTADAVERTATRTSSEPITAIVTMTVEETDVRGNLVTATPKHRVPAALIGNWMARYASAK
jgi:hypothetical protein